MPPCRRAVPFWQKEGHSLHQKPKARFLILSLTQQPTIITYPGEWGLIARGPLSLTAEPARAHKVHEVLKVFQESQENKVRKARLVRRELPVLEAHKAQWDLRVLVEYRDFMDRGAVRVR